MSECPVTIIICTKNRAESLRSTLRSIAACRQSRDARSQLIVVDNGSSDETKHVVNEAKKMLPRLRYLYESRAGQCYARNRGIAESSGRVILFTDDDIRVPANWVAGMSAPLLDGTADAVVGGIRMAPHLDRDWMRPEHRLWLACNDGIGQGEPSPDLVGANMGFTRTAINHVGGFDVSIGPGRGMGGDDTLLSWQLKAGGFKIIRLASQTVEHHFDPERLTRNSLVRTARKSGWNDAYLAYHWLHRSSRHPRLAITRCWLRLWYHRMRRPLDWIGVYEGITVWEKGMIQELAASREHLEMLGTPRRY